MYKPIQHNQKSVPNKLKKDTTDKTQIQEDKIPLKNDIIIINNNNSTVQTEKKQNQNQTENKSLENNKALATEQTKDNPSNIKENILIQNKTENKNQTIKSEQIINNDKNTTKIDHKNNTILNKTNPYNKTSIIEIEDSDDQIIQMNGEVYLKHQNKDSNSSVMVNLKNIKNINLQDAEISISNDDEQEKILEEKYLTNKYQPFVWSPLLAYNQFPSKRGGHSLNVFGDYMVIFGGCYLDLECFNDLHFYNIRNKEWTQPKVFGSPPLPRSGHTSVMVGASMYIFGGSSQKGLHDDLHVLDLETRSWKQLNLEGPVPDPRTNHGAVLDEKGRIVIFGGYTVDGYTNDVYFINLVVHRWERPQIHGKLPIPRESFGFEYIRDSIIYMFGGYALGQPVSDIYELNLDYMKWIKLESRGEKPSARQGFGFIRHDRDIYVFGGCDSSQNKCYSEMYSLNVDSLQWSKIELKNTPVLKQENMGSAKLGSNIISFGGCELLQKCSNNLMIMNITEPCNCNNHGICRNERCICDQGYFGEDCSIPLICSHQCLSRGICQSNGKCQCFPGYAGQSCELFIPCPQNCTNSEQGLCSQNSICECKEGFQGDSCELKVHIEKEIDGEQKNDGEIQLKDSHRLNNRIKSEKQIKKEKLNAKKEKLMQDGESLSHLKQNEVYDIKCQNDCSLNGFCNHKTGFCICNQGFGGFDCSENIQKNDGEIKQKKNKAKDGEISNIIQQKDTEQSINSEKEVKNNNDQNIDLKNIDGEISNPGHKAKIQKSSTQYSHQIQSKKRQDKVQEESEENIQKDTNKQESQQGDASIKQQNVSFQDVIPLGNIPLDINNNNNDNEGEIQKNKRILEKFNQLNNIQNISDFINQEEQIPYHQNLQQKSNKQNEDFEENTLPLEDQVMDEENCPNECSKNGLCINYLCYCRQGAMGEDCSITKLKHLKEGSKPIEFVYYGLLWLLIGLLIGYIVIRQFQNKQNNKDFNNLESLNASSVDYAHEYMNSSFQSQQKLNNSQRDTQNIHQDQSQNEQVVGSEGEQFHYESSDNMDGNSSYSSQQDDINESINHNKQHHNHHHNHHKEEQDENPGFFQKIFQNWFGKKDDKNKQQQNKNKRNIQNNKEPEDDEEYCKMLDDESNSNISQNDACDSSQSQSFRTVDNTFHDQ